MTLRKRAILSYGPLALLGLGPVNNSPISTRKSPLQERSRRTVERILDAAARTYHEQGYAGSTTSRVHLVEHPVELAEHHIDHRPDPADRMILRDQVLRRQSRQHRQLRIGAPTHAPIRFDPAAEREHPS